MRNLLLFGGLLLIAHPAFAGPCLPGTLSDYISQGSCTLNQVEFTDFFLAELLRGATEIDPGLAQITPGGPAYAPTLLLTLNTTANAGEVLQSSFHFTAFSNSLLGAFISLGSPLVAGDGAVTGILDVCADGFFLGVEPVGCNGSALTAVVFSIDGDSQLSSRLDFPASSFFDIFVDITIDGGTAGSASLDSAGVGVVTPEPSTLLLLTLPFAGLGYIKLRRWRRH